MSYYTHSIILEFFIFWLKYNGFGSLLCEGQQNWLRMVTCRPLLLRFYVFYVFFSKSKKWLFTFFAVSHTFSRTMHKDTRMAISPQRVIRYTSCLVLGRGFQGRWIEWRYFRLHQKQVGGRPPSWIISNGNISATAHSIHLYSAHRAFILCDSTAFLFAMRSFQELIAHKIRSLDFASCRGLNFTHCVFIYFVCVRFMYLNFLVLFVHACCKMASELTGDKVES